MGRSAFMLVILALLPAAAAAQAATPAKSAAEVKARESFKEGQRAYNVGRFDDALNAYARAYELSSHPALLFNMAQCHRQLGNWERAAFFYRRYLTLSPERPKNADLVAELIREVEQKQARAEAEAEEKKRRAAAQAPAQPVLTPAAPPPLEEPLVATSLAPGADEPAPPLWKKWWFWAGVGGAVAAGTATALVASGGSDPEATTLGSIDAR